MIAVTVSIAGIDSIKAPVGLWDKSATPAKDVEQVITEFRFLIISGNFIKRNREIAKKHSGYEPLG